MITITKVGSLVKIDGIEGHDNVYESISNFQGARMSTDGTQLSLQIGEVNIGFKDLSQFTIGGTVPTNAATVQTALQAVFPSAAPATALPTETVATYSAMQTSITADSTTKRDFFVSGDETNVINGVAQFSKYYYNGSQLQKVGMNGAVQPTPPTYSVLPGGGGTATIDADGKLTCVPSGSFNTNLSSFELNYFIIRPAQWIAFGLLANGVSAIVSTSISTIGQVKQVSSTGALTGGSQLFPTSAIPSTAVRVKVSYNTSGDLTIAYSTTENGSFTTWGTVTRAALIAAGYTVVSQQMGVLNVSSSITYLVEFETKAGVSRLFNKRLELVENQDLFSKIYPWYNKTCVVYGDSMTAEYNNTTGAYTDKVKSKLKLRSVIRKGFSGYPIGQPTDGAGNYLALTSILNEAINTWSDLYIIWAGVNDFIHGVVLGDATKVTDTTASPTTSTVGGLNYILNYIKTNRPLSTIVFCTPIPCANPAQTTANTQGKILKDYVDAIKIVCEYYSIPIVDLFAKMNVAANISGSITLYTIDSLHPNDTGYDRITSIQARHINLLN